MPKIIAAGVGLPLIGTGATITTSQPLLNLTQTWNNVATTFTGLKFNVTDTASAVGSMLMDLQVGGSTRLAVNKFGGLNSAGNVVLLNNSGQYVIGSALDVVIARDAANTLALRNGTAAQKFNVYNTYTDASNYERGVFDFIGTANALRIGTENLGTGLVRGIRFVIGGTEAWLINPSSHFLASTDNTYDIGATAGNRPRRGYFGTSIQAPYFVSLNGTGQLSFPTDGVFKLENGAGSNSVSLTIGASNLLTLNGGLTTGNTVTVPTLLLTTGGSAHFTSRGYITPVADGVFRLANEAGTDFTRLILGTNDASGVSLVKSGTSISFRNGDNTGGASLVSYDLLTTGPVTASTFVKTTAKTFATLTAAATAGAGARSFVTDANATMAAGIGTIVVGGGSNAVPVYSDGTNWLIG